MPITVAIVEDEPSELKALRDAVEASDGMQCVGAYATAETALKQFPLIGPDVALVDLNLKRVLRREAPCGSPDVALVDLNLKRMQGIRLIWKLKRMETACKIIVHSIETDARRVFQSLQAGALGYLVKGATGEEIRGAIADIHQGGSPMTPSIARLVIRSFQRLSRGTIHELGLTQRLEETLRLLGMGYSNQEIADALGISVDTVKSHVQQIYQTLQLHSRNEVIAWWHEQGNGS